jgi:hypothetical protein
LDRRVNLRRRRRVMGYACEGVELCRHYRLDNGVGLPLAFMLHVFVIAS